MSLSSYIAPTNKGTETNKTSSSLS
jgi:hypothetical protein